MARLWTASDGPTRQEQREARVLEVLRRYPGTRFWSTDLANLARIWGGAAWGMTIDSLEDAGLIESAWDDGPEPRRRVYWLAPAAVTDEP